MERPSMPGKQARALCPVCREAMPPDETECQNCGAFVIDEAVVRLSRAFGIDREKALQLFEAGFRHPVQLKDRNVDDVLERRESGLLFLCTNCGGFVASGDSTCPRCGAEFEVGEEEEPAWTGEEEDILDLVLCPNCGADNGPDEAECEICGESLRPAPETPPVAEAPAKAAAKAPKPEAGHDELEKVDLMLDDLEPSKIPDKEALPSSPRAVAAGTARQVSPPRSVPREPPPRPIAKAAESVEKQAPRPPVSPKPPVRQAPREVQTRAPAPTPSIPKAVRTPTKAAKVAEPAAKIVKRPVEIRVAQPRRPRAVRPKSKRWTGPPPEYMGPAVAASALGLYASRVLDQAGAAWGIAFALAAFSGYAIAASHPSRTARVTRLDLLLLAAGSILGSFAFVVHAWVSIRSPELLSVLAATNAIPFAWATRRLLRSPARALLAAGGGLPLIALAIAAAEGFDFAETAAWSIGLLAAIPWPLAIVFVEVRDRVVARAARRHLIEAERDYARQDYAKSLEDYDRAIALTEKGAARQDLPWYGKGATLVLLGQYEEALRAIDRALDINPRNEVAWVNKGNALTKLGRFVDALRCFNAALKVNPGYEVAWNNKGNALARLGRYEEALRCYEKALDIDATYRGAWVNKGYVLAKLGRFDEAAACADQVLRLAARERVETA